MSKRGSFSTAQLQKRLSKARRQGEQRRSAAEKYALLAAIDPPEHPARFLKGLSTWPCHLYAEVDPELRRVVLEWLIGNVSTVSSHDERHAWLEQWHVELLQFVSLPKKQLEQLAASTEERKLTEWSRKLYMRLQELSDSPSIKVSWLRHLTRASAWSEVISTAEKTLAVTVDGAVRSQVYSLFIEALLKRDASHKQGQTDAEHAMVILAFVRREGLWNGDFERLLKRATEATLPEDLKEGRGRSTNLLADAYRGLSRVSKMIGKVFGGRDAQVPYSKGVIKSAPSMLAPARVEKFLASSKKHIGEFRQVLGEKIDLEATAVAGALTLEGLWTLSQIDDSVLDAMTFASAGTPDTFWRLQDLAESYDGSQGAIARLAGYVAEQQVATDLIREGHIVTFPEGPIQPGWDLLVDGHPVQVKLSLDPDYVLSHFERYPDIPVIVNAELADALGDHPMVLVDHALSHADVMATTEESLDALADFADVDDLLPIPLIALAFSAYRNFGDLRVGRIDQKTFAQRVGVDMAARTLGGGTGAFIGSAAGSVLGPIGTVVGASIGGFIGSIAGRTGADAINRREICDARDAVVSALGEFARWFRSELLIPRVALLKERHERITRWMFHALQKEWAPSCTVIFYSASTEMLRRARTLNDWIAGKEKGDDFARAHAGWVALREASTFFHPELKTRLASVQQAIQTYERISKSSTADNSEG